ncbi:MAG: 2-amino-4-hydroxy-6-hydroxymethyldihydropteridine diphosphokinase [Candidatus Omnitrophota bacterium]
MEICYLGLGSNLGKRRQNIMTAIKKIRSLKSTKIIKVSRFFETEAIGGPVGQGKFLNAAAKVTTALPPLKFLKELKKIESGLGRTRTVRNGPRPIDLDILFYGRRVINTKLLTVPHPRMFSRDFVLKPLSEIL